MLKSLPLVLISLAFTYPVSAQVIPDNSLGNESSTVTPNVTVKDTLADLIEGGAIRGNNLFHSFSEFNVSEGGNVYFANPDGISNILTRVTGSDISNIFGTLGTDGAANLFLLNPNGIIFGENAALDLNGSFFATTAESYVFENGLEFSAVNPEAAPMLTINFTPGLQMGSNSGTITVRGNGHLLTGGFATPLRHNNNSTGLQVKPSKTLGLIGSEINLTGGILKVPGGNIQLSSIEQGILHLDTNTQSWQLNTSQVQEFGDIEFSDKALLDTSGFLTGNIQLQGKNISLEDGSVVLIQNFGTQPSGHIEVKAADTLTISGSVRNAPEIVTPSVNITGVIASRLSTETLGVGKGGNIVVSSGNLSLSDGSWIVARSYGNSNTGNININVSELIEINNFSPLNPNISSTIGTFIFDSGDAGQTAVSARDITILDGGQIVSANFGSGRGGDIWIHTTKDLKISGFNSNFVTSSVIGSSAFSKGSSGDVAIDVMRLSLSDRGTITTSTFAEGDAGTLTIDASEQIEIIGTNEDAQVLALNTVIASDAPILDFGLRQVSNLPARPSGNSGNLILNTPNLTLIDSGSVTVKNEGLGNSGSLQINADRVFLDARSSINGFSASGTGGNLELNIADSLLLGNSSSISAEAKGALVNQNFNINGGNININADTVTLLENSQVNARAFEGNGGNIDVFTQGLFISPNSQITASSEYGLDGNVEINEVNGDRKFELDRLPENVTDLTNLITVTCLADNNNAFAVVGNGGIPNSPYQTQSLNTTWYDLRPVKPETAKVASQPASLTEATTTMINANGELELVALTPLSTHRWINSSCSS